jgi:hypothetical protein
MSAELAAKTKRTFDEAGYGATEVKRELLKYALLMMNTYGRM